MQSPDIKASSKISLVPFKLIQYDPMKSFGFFLNSKPKNKVKKRVLSKTSIKKKNHLKVPQNLLLNKSSKHISALDNISDTSSENSSSGNHSQTSGFIRPKTWDFYDKKFDRLFKSDNKLLSKSKERRFACKRNGEHPENYILNTSSPWISDYAQFKNYVIKETPVSEEDSPIKNHRVKPSYFSNNSTCSQTRSANTTKTHTNANNSLLSIVRNLAAIEKQIGRTPYDNQEYSGAEIISKKIKSTKKKLKKRSKKNDSADLINISLSTKNPSWKVPTQMLPDL